MDNISRTDFRVREVKRFIVTRHDEALDGATGSTVEKGEFPNYEVAFEVAYALAEAERISLGLSLDDARVQFPKKYTSGVVNDVAAKVEPKVGELKVGPGVQNVDPNAVGSCATVIKGKGFNYSGGGFMALVIDGREYDADTIAEALRRYFAQGELFGMQQLGG